MIFGATKEQVFEKTKVREQRHEARKERHKFFCLFPRQLDTGRYAWLMYVERRSEWHSSYTAGHGYWENFYQEMK